MLLPVLSLGDQRDSPMKMFKAKAKNIVFILYGVHLIYNVVLISGVQLSDLLYLIHSLSDSFPI